jgi:hypothetical protein
MITITIFIHTLTSFRAMQGFGTEMTAARHAGKKKAS